MKTTLQPGETRRLPSGATVAQYDGYYLVGVRDARSGRWARYAKAPKRYEGVYTYETPNHVTVEPEPPARGMTGEQKMQWRLQQDADRDWEYSQDNSRRVGP